VDDDESVLTAIPRLLRVCGFRTEAFDSGRTFLDALPDRRPDCVLLDLYMPDLTGWETLAGMAASGYFIPVILITGDGAPDLLEKAMATGAAALLRKPFSEQQLLEAIAAAMSKTPQ
jgi:FixJ family two-component response regulator